MLHNLQSSLIYSLSFSFYQISLRYSSSSYFYKWGLEVKKPTPVLEPGCLHPKLLLLSLHSFSYRAPDILLWVALVIFFVLCSFFICGNKCCGKYIRSDFYFSSSLFLSCWGFHLLCVFCLLLLILLPLHITSMCFQ